MADLEFWLSNDAAPRDLYELIGAERFFPHRDVLLRNLRGSMRKLMQYERHDDPTVARRATRLQRETATADRTLRDHELLRQTHLGMLQALANEWKSARAGGGDPAGWLREQSVHADRIPLVAAALQSGRFAEAVDAMDWIDAAGTASVTLSGDDDDMGTASGPLTIDDLLPPGLSASPPRPAAGPPYVPAAPWQATPPRPMPIAPAAPTQAAHPAGLAAARPAAPTGPIPSPQAAPATHPADAPRPGGRRAKARTRRWAAVAVLVALVGGGAAIFATGNWPLGASTAPTLEFVSEIVGDEERPLEHVFAVKGDAPDVAADEVELIGTLPPGLQFDAARRRLTWTPTEREGPGRYPLVIRFRRARWNAPDQTVPFNLVVREVNRAPQVRVVPNFDGNAGEMVSRKLDLIDPDIPANKVRLELVDPSARAVLNHPTDGWVSIRTELEIGRTNQVRVRLIDDGNPPASSETVFSAATRGSIASGTISAPPGATMGSSPLPSTMPAPKATGGAATPTTTSTAATSGPLPTATPSTTAAAVAPAIRPAPGSPAGSVPDLSRLTKLFETEFDGDLPEFRPRTGFLTSSVRNGVLTLLRDPNDSGGKRFPCGDLSQFLLTDFACEVKLRFTSDASGDCGVVMERYRNQFLLSTDDDCRMVTNNRRAIPEGILRKGDWNSLLYVVRNRRVSGYLNGTLIGGPEDVDSETVFPARVWIGFGGAPAVACEIDKFTLWNLAGVSDASMAPTPPAPPPPTVAFEPDYDSVDLPPMKTESGVATLRPGYCSPAEVATIGLELATAADVGPLGLEFKLQPATSASGERRWDVVPVQNGATKAAAAQFALAANGALGFTWLSTEPSYEHLRNSVVFASPAGGRRPLVLRRFTRLPPLLIDTAKGSAVAALGDLAGFFRLDGLQLELLGLTGFPTEAKPTQAGVAGSQKISVTYNPGQIEMAWVLSLVKQKGALTAVCSMQALDGKRIVQLTKQLVNNETKAIAQQTAVTNKKLEQIMLNRMVAELTRGSVNSPADVNAFNAAVEAHNQQVALTQAALAALGVRQEVFNQVTGTIDGLTGKAAMRLRVYFTVNGKQFEIGRAE